MDYNVDNYTIEELFTILDLDYNEQPTNEEIIDNTNEYINKYTYDEPNENLSNFFQKVQSKLLKYNNELNKNNQEVRNQEEDEIYQPDNYQPNNEQTNLWYKYEALPQNDKTQKDKNTDRIQKIDVYDNQHVPMNRQQLGINNNFNVDIAQDTLNPNLKNITSRLIILDSQFRQASSGINSSSTDYSLDLSDPLTNVLSLRLYSFSIPFTWYVIDEVYGNTCFWVVINGEHILIKIPSGNYNYNSFVDTLNELFSDANFTHSTPSVVPVSFNNANGKITIDLEGFSYNGNPINNILNPLDETFNPLINPYFLFFDFEGQYNCISNSCYVQNISFDNTLGWLMGYRTPIVPLYNSGNEAPSILDLNGTKYFIVVLDDYNQNHINNGLVGITELSKKLDLPNYYIPTLPHFCVPNVNNITNNVFNNDQSYNTLSDKLDKGFGSIEQVLPTAPRVLTQAQIYTINEIIKNRKQNTSFKNKAPTSSDTFAIIPIKKKGLDIGDMYVEFSGPLQDNKRIYFGPVNIERMRIKLLDDRGFVVNLNGSDWCITLISENLYQY